MNKYIATGNLVREPELNYSRTGTAFFRNAIAVKDDYKKDVTHFFNFTAFGKTAETMANYLQKGSKVLIEASLAQNSYEKDGQKRTTIELNVNRFEFLDSKNSQNNAPQGNSSNRQGNNQGGGNNRPQGNYNAENDPFMSSGQNISIDPDDLPF